MMQQWIFLAFFDAGRPANYNHRRFFRERFGGCVCDLKSAHTIGDANHTQPLHASIRIGSEPGSLLIASVEDAQLAFGKQVVKSQHVIAWNPENMAYAMVVKTFDEVFANRR